MTTDNQNLNKSDGEYDAPPSDGRPVDAMIEIVDWTLDRALDGAHDLGDVFAIEHVRAAMCGAILGDVVEPPSELDCLRTIGCAITALEQRYGASTLTTTIAQALDTLAEALLAEATGGPQLAAHVYCVP